MTDKPKLLDEKVSERLLRMEIEDAVARAREAGWSREQVTTEVEYALDAAEDG